MLKFRSILSVLLISGYAALPAAADGLNIAMRKLSALEKGCRADLELANGWRRDLVRFAIDIYILDKNGQALERQVVDIAPLPAGRTTRAQFPLHSACADIGGLRIVAIPSCRLEGDTRRRDCLADLTVQPDTVTPITVEARR